MKVTKLQLRESIARIKNGNIRTALDKKLKPIVESVLNEVQLVKNSIIFGGGPSVDYNVDETGKKFEIWLNGGSPYAFEFNVDALKNMSADWRNLKNELENIAINTAKFIEKEMIKLEKKYK